MAFLQLSTSSFKGKFAGQTEKPRRKAKRHEGKRNHGGKPRPPRSDCGSHHGQAVVASGRPAVASPAPLRFGGSPWTAARGSCLRSSVLGHPLPLPLLLSPSFLLLCFAGVQLLLSQDQMEQGFDSLDSSCAYKANTIKA